MSNATFEQYNEQVEKVFVGPARTYASLVLDHADKLFAAQFEAVKSYSDFSFGQVRAALDIKDSKGFEAYVKGQQKVAEDFGKKVKGDAEKVAALGQDFVEQAQKLAQENVKNVSKATAAAK